MLFPPVLYPGATQTASFTAAAGFIYRIDVTTAQIDVTFPTSPVADARFGYYIGTQSTTTGSFVLAPGKAVEPNNPTINSAAYTKLTAGSGKWGLWLSGEILIFRYVDATVGWVVEYDGRIAMLCAALRNTAQTITTGANRLVQLNTTSVSVGELLDATNYRLSIKRSGNYHCTIKGTATLQDDTEKIDILGYKNGTGGTLLMFARDFSPAGDQTLQATDSSYAALVGTDYVDLYMQGTDTFDTSTSNGLMPGIFTEEIL